MKSTINKALVRFNVYRKTTAYACFKGVAPWAILIIAAILYA